MKEVSQIPTIRLSGQDTTVMTVERFVLAGG